MTGPGDGITPIARACLRETEPNRYARNNPTRYADPVAWLLLAAVEQALTGHDEITAAADEVAVVVCTAESTRRTMGAVAAAAARGRSSPLRFAGSNPGTVAALICIEQGFRGPSLALSAYDPPGTGIPAAVAGSWLRTGKARYAVLAAHRTEPDGTHAADCLLLGTDGSAR
jgi:hypothetical protein